MREYFYYKTRLKQCTLFLSLVIVILMVCQMYTSINLPLSSVLKDEDMAHPPPLIVMNTYHQPLSSSSLRLLSISAASNSTTTDNVSTAATTAGQQSKTSIMGGNNDNYDIPSISSKSTALTLVDESEIIWIPQEPDPNPLLHMAWAWTDENGTEIPSLQPNDPIHPIRNGSCPVTSQFQILITSSASNSSGASIWKLLSLDINGTRKTIGGDEFYVTYKDYAARRRSPVLGGHHLRPSPTAVAYAKDQGDGSYELDFHMSPFSSVPLERLLGRGKLTIKMQYTCGVGMIPNNEKSAWGSGGLLGKVVYRVPVPIRPSITKFVQPNADKAIDLGKYKKVLVFGDSNMIRFALPVTNLCKIYQQGKHPSRAKDCTRNMKWTINVNSQLSMNTLRKRFLPRIQTMIHATLREEPIGLEEMALVVGSHTWDLMYDDRQGRDFRDHRKAVETLLRTIQDEYPTLDLYWRSTMAVHTQAATNVREDWHQIKPLYYLSTARARNLYEFQKQIVTEINRNSTSTSTITHLDVYHATYLSAEYMERADVRHFTHEWNSMATNWFYKEPS
jgi:hypothetical protein